MFQNYNTVIVYYEANHFLEALRLYQKVVFHDIFSTVFSYHMKLYTCFLRFP